MARIPTLLAAAALTLRVAAQIPTNDSCAFPQPLTINDLLECPLLATPGDNGQASWGGDLPVCDGNGLSFPDVWYTFNSDIHSEVFLRLVPGSITDWGIEVMPDSCLATSFVCGVWPLFEFTIPTTPGTNYRVRVFTNTDFGAPGTFGICLSAAMPPLLCDGNIVKTDQGDTTLTICKDGLSDLLTFVSFSQGTSPVILVLTDDGDNIVAELPGGLLEADTLRDGAYRIHAVSWDGALFGLEAGLSIRDLTSDGACLELSDNFVELFVEICTGVQGVEVGQRAVWMDGDVLCIGPDRDQQGAWVTVLDAVGRSVHRSWVSAGSTSRITLPEVARGALLVRLDSEGSPPVVRRVVR
ncbi:MAG: hypothetical protein IPM49_10220 [Flavobacteriales bacterium]|nr:hypothetical protein [Flavobacteriales bacterium]